MNQFIDFGKTAIARHIIRQVFFIDDKTVVVDVGDGPRDTFHGIDKASIMQQLNPPRSNVAYFTHMGGQQ